MSDTMADLEGVAKLSMAERIGPLTRLGLTLLEAGANGSAAALVPMLVEVLESGEGSSVERMQLGEVLGRLGDPRLASPADDRYWVAVDAHDGPLHVARFPVTNQEFLAFSQDGYARRELWSEAGWAWLQQTPEPWPVQASREAAASLVIPNQPVVGVTFFEAEAYANSVGARLPRADERVSVVRGAEKRPYPWGAPFGEGNANTREEVLARPCAVGLFVRDCTPDGVRDLAGNVAEWTADTVGDEMLIHPGAWDQPSMAAWAKALSMASPSSRWAGLGFRLVK